MRGHQTKKTKTKNFQVNTLVGLFWIMLKISTWLVVYFAPLQILFTQSTSSLLKMYTLHIFFFFFFHLTHSRWTSSLPSCLWSQRIFPSLPGSRLTIFYRDASSALLRLVNQWLNFTYSRSHAFRYERKNTNTTLVGIELTSSVPADVQLTC